MKKASRLISRIVLWPISVFLFLSYLIYFPTISSFLMLAMALLLAPVSKTQVFLKSKRIFGIRKALVFIILSFANFIFLPASGYTSSFVMVLLALLLPVTVYLSTSARRSNNKNSAVQPTTTPSPTSLSNTENIVSTATDSSVYTTTEKSREELRAEFIKRKQDEFSHTLSDIPHVDVVPSATKINRAKMLDMPEIKISNITRATVLDRLFPMVVLDVETTGIKVGGNDIIEVSAIKYDVGFQPVSCFNTLCKPRKPIPPDATAINHITDEMVQNYPSFHYIAQPFSEYIAGCNIVGHNVLFDLRFLFISGVTLPPKARYFDTLDLVKKVLTKNGSRKYDHHAGEYCDIDNYDVEDYKLETLCDYYGIYRSDAHRSLSDCYATATLFKHLIDDKTS